MPIILRILLYLAILFYFVWMYKLLKKQKLNLQYSLMWIFSGIILLVLVTFIKDFEKVLHFLGIAEGMNGLFAIAIFLILLMLMIITSIVSQMNNRHKTLIQKCALLEKRVRELENQMKGEQNNANDNSVPD